MIDNIFREKLPRFVRPLLKFYKLLELNPNSVTIAGCLTGLASALFVSQGFFILGLALWWAGRLLDGTDGIYARHFGKTSEVGAYLDINCDMLAYSAMILAFFKIWPVLSLNWIIIMALYVLCISGALSLGSLQGPTAHSSSRKLQLAAGLAEGGETGIFYSCCLVFPNYIQPLSLFWITVLIATVLARATLAFQSLNKERSLR
ncbi:MAG: CDP-alcohol phosphatidyltransferase family protein [Bdellovibrionia bacterium]